MSAVPPEPRQDIEKILAEMEPAPNADRRRHDYPELRAMIDADLAARRELDRERAEWLRKLNDDGRSAVEASERRDVAIPARYQRATASLVIRCNDCDGLTVATLTYVEDRLLLRTRQRDRTYERSWLDDGYWGDVAYCRVREFNLHTDVLMSAVPAPGKKPFVVRVSHRPSGRAVL